MKIALARSLTGRGEYTPWSLFRALKQPREMSVFSGDKTPENSNNFSLRIKQSSTTELTPSIRRQHSTNSTSPHAKNYHKQYADSTYRTCTTSIARHPANPAHQTSQITQNNQLDQTSENKKRCKLAYDNTCIGWKGVHRSRGTQLSLEHIVEQNKRCSTQSTKNKLSNSLAPARLVITPTSAVIPPAVRSLCEEEAKRLTKQSPRRVFDHWSSS